MDSGARFSKFDEKLSVSRILESIDAKLLIIEYYVACDVLSAQQLALLYGTTEKLQLHEIDVIVFPSDLNDEMLAAWKSQRKELAQRANKALDALERLASGRSLPLISVSAPPLLYGALALCTNTGQKVASIALGVSIHSGYKTSFVLPLQSTTIMDNTNFGNVFEEAQKVLVQGGYLSECCRLCLCALLTLPLQAYYEKKLTDEGTEVNFMHAHTALACHIKQELSSTGSEKHLFVSRTSGNSFSLSFARISADSGVKILQTFEIQRTNALFTSSDADFVNSLICLASFPWHKIGQGLDQQEALECSRVWVDDGSEGERRGNRANLKELFAPLIPGSSVQDMGRSEEVARSMAYTRVANYPFSHASNEGRSLSPVTTEVARTLSDVLSRIVTPFPIGKRGDIEISEVSRCVIGLVATTDNVDIAGGQTLMPFIFPSDPLGSIVEKSVSLTGVTSSLFRLQLGLRPGASLLTIEDVGTNHEIYVHLPRVEVMPCTCRVRIIYTIHREIRLCVSYPNNFAQWSNEATVQTDTTSLHLCFQESPSQETPSTTVQDITCSCPESGLVFKAAGDSRVTAHKDLHVAYGLYTLALAYDPNNAKLWSNRSACAMYLKMGKLALQDATCATKCDAKWAKGYIRQGDANAFLFRLDDAIASYKSALEIDSGNESINCKLVAVLEKREASELSAVQSKRDATSMESEVSEKGKKDSNCACM